MAVGLIFRTMFLVLRRYQSILLTVILTPILVGVIQLYLDSSQLGPALMLLLFIILWSFSGIITNIFCVFHGDLRSLMLYPRRWILVTIFRNGIMFSAIMTSVAVMIVSMYFLCYIDLDYVAFLAFHSVVVVLTALSIGNTLSAKSPRPFPQNPFSWKGFLMMVPVILVSGLINTSYVVGGLLYQIIVLTMLTISLSLYYFSVLKSSSLLVSNLQHVIDSIDE